MEGPVASVRIEAGPHAGSSHPVGAGGVIGRLTTCAVPLPDDDEVSRRHAAIEVVGGSFRLRDLASRNGTSCNGEPVTDAPLQDGDLIQVGVSRLRFEMAGRVSPAAPEAAMRGAGELGADEGRAAGGGADDGDAGQGDAIERHAGRGRRGGSRSSRRRGSEKLRASEVVLFLALLVLVYLVARTLTDVVLIIADRIRPG